MATKNGVDESWMGWKYYGDLLPTRMKYHTRKVIEECFFSWTLENLDFVLMGEQPGYTIKSLQFPTDKDKVYKWTVEFLPLGTSDYKNEALVVVSLESSPKIAAKIKCEVMFRDLNGSKLIEEPLTGCFTANQANQKLNLMISRKVLFKKLSLEANNQSVLNIEVKIICAVDDSKEYLEIEESSAQEMLSALNLIEDLSMLLKNEQSSDIIVKVKETACHAHRAILTARSPVLAAMFQHDTKEKHEKVIHIKDFEPDVMEKILRFLYTSRIVYKDVNEAMQILEFGEKYDIQTLKKLCEDYLIFKLNTGNVLNILNVANVHNAADLKSKAIDYICENRDSFTDPKNYATANVNSNLLMEVLAAMADATKQNIKT